MTRARPVSVLSSVRPARFRISYLHSSVPNVRFPGSCASLPFNREITTVRYIVSVRILPLPSVAPPHKPPILTRYSVSFRGILPTVFSKRITSDENTRARARPHAYRNYHAFCNSKANNA